MRIAASHAHLINIKRKEEPYQLASDIHWIAKQLAAPMILYGL